MIHKAMLIFLLLMVTLRADTIRIAVASNMGYVMKPLKAMFTKQHPQTKVVVSLGSSGKLSAQIMHGAPYDIFISADMFFAKRLYDGGFTTDAPKIYAQGALALFSAKRKDFSKGLHILEQHNVHTVAMANPKTAPYGKAAMEVLERSGIFSKIRSKLVYGESIGHALSYALSVADVGLVAKSSLFAPKMRDFKQNEHWIEIDKTLYSPINQGIVLLKNSKNSKEAQAFYRFMLGNGAQKILKNFGYHTL